MSSGPRRPIWAITFLAVAPAIEFVVTLIALLVYAFGLLDLNGLAKHALHLALWFLWEAAAWRYTSAILNIVTFAIGIIAAIVDLIVTIVQAIDAYNCFGQGTGGASCPPPPFTATTEAITAAFGFFYFLVAITATLNVYEVMKHAKKRAMYNAANVTRRKGKNV